MRIAAWRLKRPRVTARPEAGCVVLEVPGEEPLVLTAGQAGALADPAVRAEIRRELPLEIALCEMEG